MDIAIFKSLIVKIESDSKKIVLIKDALIKSLKKETIIKEEVLYLVTIYRTVMIETLFGTLMPLRFLNDAIKTFLNITKENRVEILSGGQKGGLSAKAFIGVIGLMFAFSLMFNVFDYQTHTVLTLDKNPENFTQLKDVIDKITFKGELGKTIKDSILNNPPQIIHFNKKEGPEQLKLIQECLNYHNKKLAEIIPDKTLLPLFELKFTDNNDLHVTLPMSTITNVIGSIKTKHEGYIKSLNNWVPTLDTFGEMAFDTAAVFGTDKLVSSIRNINLLSYKDSGTTVAKKVAKIAFDIALYGIERPREALGTSVAVGIVAQQTLDKISEYAIKPIAKTALNIDKSYTQFLENITGNPSEKLENITDLFNKFKELDTETNKLLAQIKKQARSSQGKTNLNSMFSSKYVKYLNNFSSSGMVINAVKDTAVDAAVLGANIVKEVGVIGLKTSSTSIFLLFSGLLDSLCHPVDTYHRITSYGTGLFVLFAFGLWFSRYILGTIRKPASSPKNKTQKIRSSSVVPQPAASAAAAAQPRVSARTTSRARNVAPLQFVPPPEFIAKPQSAFQSAISAYGSRTRNKNHPPPQYDEIPYAPGSPAYDPNREEGEVY
jgi:hypothetical protein